MSTLGKFVNELACAQGRKCFSLAVFAGGGKVRLAGELLDGDERNDDPAFNYLALAAKYKATIFDLRSLRQKLHLIPSSERTAAEESLVYWVDSYDAILYYSEVTPR